MSSMNHLFEQFKRARGYETLENENEVVDEFISWISIQQEMGKNYSKLLKNMGLNINKKECAEVGKGKYDSIASQYKTTIITPDEDIQTKGILINTGFRVFNGKPTAVSQGARKKIIFGEINTKLINTFMTQNPYREGYLDNWGELPNFIVGIYGNRQDKDLKEKINILKKFKNNLCRKCINEQVMIDDTYFEIVATQKVKRIGA